METRVKVKMTIVNGNDTFDDINEKYQI